GLVVLGAAGDFGMSDDQVKHRLMTGELVRVFKSVYRYAAVAPSFDQRLLAACLAAGDDTVASHRAGGVRWELRGGRAKVPEITVPQPRDVDLPGVIVHTTNLLDAADVTEHRGIPITSPARTLIDLGAVAPGLVSTAVEDAVYQGLVTYPYMWRTVKRLSAKGRRGIRCMR